ncbi:MAG TPA: DsbA family protein [Pseudomonadales bacterium]|nr:DsbA family protein [Pseudomonadales bacterium]
MSKAPLTEVFGDVPAVYIDFKNPKAYLALRPTFALEDELDIAFDWWPVPVSAMSRPQPEQPNEDRGTRHRRIRAGYYERDLHRYASVYGIELADLYRNPDVAVASIGMLWVKERARESLREYVDAVFGRFWQQRLALDDAGAIEALIGEFGVDTAGFQSYASGEGRASFERTAAALREAGIFDVPAYVVEREIFFGRAHLPMVRWLLTGKAGEPPI